MSSIALEDRQIVLLMVYVVSFILCAVLTTVEAARKEKRKYRGAQPTKYYLTYGHIMKGVALGLVPVLNAVVAAVYFVLNVIDAIDTFGNVRVFKKGSDY